MLSKFWLGAQDAWILWYPENLKSVCKPCRMIFTHQSTYNQGRKCREISCIEARPIFRDLSPEIDDFSRYIAWSTKVRPATVLVKALQCCYSASLVACCWEDLNPKPKGLEFTRLPPGLSCPLIHNMQQLYIYLNSYIKKI